MLTLSLKLFNRKHRPSFVFYENGSEVYALLDTGAETPVWCAGKSLFEAIYPNAIKRNSKCKIYGFGKEYEEALVYVIPEFKLYDEKCTYKIKGLYVAVCSRPNLGYDFIFSDTMFSKADTYIFRRNNKRLEVHFDKEEYICAVKSIKDAMSITVFSNKG